MFYISQRCLKTETQVSSSFNCPLSAMERFGVSVISAEPVAMVFNFLDFCETPSKDLDFLGLGCRTSKGSALGCIEATKECTCGGQLVMIMATMVVIDGFDKYNYRVEKDLCALTSRSSWCIFYVMDTNVWPKGINTQFIYKKPLIDRHRIDITFQHRWHFQWGLKRLSRRVCFQGCKGLLAPGEITFGLHEMILMTTGMILMMTYSS